MAAERRKPVVCLVGRPNVGKSSLFNRIVGYRKAIVDDVPGVTRDRLYADAEHAGRVFTLVDTGGFDPEEREGILALMRKQVEHALQEADAAIFVVDAKEGLLPLDVTVWEILRRSGRKAYVAVNKLDTPAQMPLMAEFHALGADELFGVSATTGAGVAELLDRIVEDLDPPAWSVAMDQDEGRAIHIALVGRPNVGKSTLANALLGNERLLTSDQPGTTRDSVDVPFRALGRDFVLVDTAGIRRRTKVEKGLERMSVARAVKSLESCHVALLLIDAAEGVTDQDKKLASLIERRGRGLVVVANKWDLVRGSKDEAAKRLREELAFVGYAPILHVSALRGTRVGRILPWVVRVHENLFRRAPTSHLNRFHAEVIENMPPGVVGTVLPKIKYLTQVGVNPPTILLFVTGKVEIPENYLRFLEKRLRQAFDFGGVPIRLIQRQSPGLGK